MAIDGSERRLWVDSGPTPPARLLWRAGADRRLGTRVFEDRAEKCTLLAFVDDATSRLMHLRFVASESAFDYFRATRGYLETHGKPSGRRWRNTVWSRPDPAEHRHPLRQ
jgi:hypothetical protein